MLFVDVGTIPLGTGLVSALRCHKLRGQKGAPDQIYLGGDPLGQFRTLDPPIVRGTAVIRDGENAEFVEVPFVIRIFVVPSCRLDGRFH